MGPKIHRLCTEVLAIYSFNVHNGVILTHRYRQHVEHQVSSDFCANLYLCNALSFNIFSPVYNRG